MMARRNIEVCLSPLLAGCHDFSGKCVVIIDVLRASSAIITGLSHGVQAFRPVAEPADALYWAGKGYVPAAERGGQVAEGFNLGNSPFSYQEGQWAGQKVALTTTNGTRAILLTMAAKQIIVAGFLNQKAVVQRILQFPGDVVLFCAGWKGQFSLEDTLSAGSLLFDLHKYIIITGDPAIAALDLYQAHENSIGQAVMGSSHYLRLAGKGLTDEIAFCLKRDLYTTVPVLIDGELVAIP
ncbi:MAG: 2-phosphosulfolactate phosphatase [Sphingomonadales bacterium]|nr:2-phosphosulfolactate phosphatase [Sphingomonadales bacterium]